MDDQTKARPASQWLTLSEAASYLDISESTLRRQIRKGKIRVKYFSPRRPRITWQEIERFLHAKEEEL